MRCAETYTELNETYIYVQLTKKSKNKLMWVAWVAAKWYFSCFFWNKVSYCTV
jgi:hypothetical protein